MFERVIAIDWSGRSDVAGQRRTIQACVVELASPPRVASLEGGRTRAGVVDWLISEHREGALIGFDFAFSFPAAHFQTMGWKDWRTALRWVAEHGEAALDACEHPYWGRPGKPCGPQGRTFRRTERAAASECRTSPKPVFQIGGAGAVGTGSLRGMPELLKLMKAGCRAWPFDGRPAPRNSWLAEIYPRWFYARPLVKQDPAARRAYLRAELPGLDAVVPPEIGVAAEDSEDAFDALVSGLGMAAFVLHRGLDRYGEAFYADPEVQLEGWILGPTPPS